jgi:hypothetical protein
MAPQVPNPYWPNLFAEANFGNNPFYTPSASQVYTSMAARLQKSWSIRRGKQFELDQVQPGEFHGEWANKDGALDPTNTVGPYAGGVVPYRGYQMRAVYPASINLLTADQATGGEATPVGPGSIPNSMNVGGDVSGSTRTIAASTTAYQGTQVFQVAMPASAPVAFYILKFLLVPVISPTSWTTPTYTYSTYVRCTTTGVNPSVAAALKFYDINHSYINDYVGATVALTGSSTAGWTRVTITQAVPAGASMVEAAVALEPSSPGSTWTFQQDGSQLELNGAASAFVVPGKNYPVYSGMIERFPQTWEYTGTYGIVQPVCVDTMALLSQTILKEAFVMDVVATSPTWFFQLNEPSGATAFNEQGGRLTGTASIFSSSLGAGTLTSGNPINAAGGAGGKFYGTDGPVVTVNNTANPNQGTVIDLTTAGSTLPLAGTAWTRMIAFRTGQNTGGPPLLANYSAGVNPGAVGYNGNMFFGLSAPFGGSNWTIGVGFYDNAGNQFGVATTPIVNDNNWHLAFVQMSADGRTITVWADAVSGSGTTSRDMHSTIAINDSVGGDAYKSSGLVNFGGSAPLNGDIALYAHWNTLLTGSQIAILTNSFKTAYLGDTSDQRYSRILGWAGYQGNSNLDAGLTTTMNYANDISGNDALTCLQNVVNTEGGRHFVGGDGTMNFQSRQRYFQQGSATATPSGPVWVFGENAGEIPYTILAFDYDPTRISNQIQVTQLSTSIVYNANDTTSQTNYGVRNLTRDNQSSNAEEVRESAYFYLSRYKDPHLRVQSLKINVSSNPSLWPSVLSFEIGQYIQINRRDPYGLRPTIVMFGFIEQITHTGDDKGAWDTELEVSPAPGTPYATFTSLRTTLNVSAAAGQPTITINGLPDAALNPVRSQLTGGQQILISGGGNAESLTIATGGVSDALAGYTTATVTFTNNLMNTYPSGSAVAEAFGTNYDTLAAFDVVQFSY